MADSNIKINIKTTYTDEGLKRLESELVEARKRLEELKAKFGTKSNAFVDEKKNIIDIQAQIKNYRTELQNLDKQQKAEAENVKRLAKEKAEAEKNAIKEVAQAQKQLAQQQKADSKLTGQSITLGSPDALRQQIKYWSEFRGTLASTDPRLQDTNNKILHLRNSLKDFGSTTKTSKFQMLEFGENLTVVSSGIFAVARAIGEVVSQFKEMTVKGAEYGVLINNFESLAGGIDKAAESLELMRKASAGNLNNQDLMEYANKMKLLGFTVGDTARLLSFVEDRSDMVKISFEKGEKALQSYILTGKAKGLQELGLNVAEVNAKMDELTLATGKAKDELSEEEIQTLRTKAILEKFGGTLEDVKNKTKDTADKLTSLQTSTENAKLEIGNFIANGLVELIDTLGIAGDRATETAGYITAIGGQLATLVPTIATLQIAFPTLFSTIASGASTAGIAIAGALGPASAAAMALIFLISLIQEGIAELKLMAKWQERVENKTPVVTNQGNETSDNTKFIRYADDIKLAPDMYEGQDVVNLSEKKFVKYDYSFDVPTEEDTKKEGSKKKYEEIKAPYRNNAGWHRGNEIINKTSTALENLIKYYNNLEIVQKKLSESDYITFREKLLELLSKEFDSTKELTSQNDEYYKIKSKLNEVDKNISIRPKSLNVVEDLPDQNLRINPSDLEPVKKIDLEEIKYWQLMKSAGEMAAQGIQEATRALGDFFGTMMSGGKSAADGVKQFMKSIVTTIINGVQAMIFAQGGAAFAKGITSFGLSLITDLPLLAAAWAGLEAAKGVISGLEAGGTFSAGTPYIVGERGAEMAVFNRPGYMVNNEKLMQLLNNPVSSSQPPINKYYNIVFDGQGFLEKEVPEYEANQWRKRF